WQGLAKVEPELCDHMASIPWFQLADTLAVGSGEYRLTGGPPLVAPSCPAFDWTPARRQTLLPSGWTGSPAETARAAEDAGTDCSVSTNISHCLLLMYVAFAR